MRMSRQQFRQWPRKAVTLLGMSGVGKTHLANRLPKNNWFHYSGDYRIGTKYLEEPILDNIKRQAMQVDFLRDLLRNDSIYIASNISVHNLEPVSSFLGKLGNPALGGLPLAEFKRRQRLHASAEAAAMKDVAEFIDKAHAIYGYEHFLNDAGGSIVELDDPEVMQTLAEHTLILYLQAGPEMEEKLVRRAVSDPKPLYYRDDFLDARLAEYLEEQGLRSAEEIDPDHFVSWIFPLLARDRRPRYEAAAEQYGYTVSAEAVEEVRTEADFIDLVADAIPDEH
jgi:hypothetical protein